MGQGKTGSGEEGGLFYWFLKWIALGPLLKLVFRPTVEGVENVGFEKGEG